MLRLHDRRTGRPEGLPGGRVLRLHVLDGAGLRTLVVADLLRRVASRAGRHVLATGAARGDWTAYNVQPLEPGGWADADVRVSGDGSVVDGFCVSAPAETGDWRSAGDLDPLAVRLALLDAPYGEPLELSAARARAAGARLDGWRDAVAGWARGAGRPLDRAYAAKAEAALAADLDAPSALAVLDEMAGADIAPGAKLETVVHLDLLLGLDLVSAIGRA
ncbi:hypothetical protein [Actinomadura litoris]|uniref:Cysteinyl-tRNA synthetase n=1 Tax=Actinomadura litoris TaxID=2678616 RepID=A0A7K1L604_9ACTN|nr:hypothetical protein [Actinomadura litoris]MUN39819.1 hypothetical protein [Actinomadura litoris]